VKEPNYLSDTYWQEKNKGRVIKTKVDLTPKFTHGGLNKKHYVEHCYARSAPIEGYHPPVKYYNPKEEILSCIRYSEIY